MLKWVCFRMVGLGNVYGRFSESRFHAWRTLLCSSITNMIGRVADGYGPIGFGSGFYGHPQHSM